jgi:hypothetical protein
MAWNCGLAVDPQQGAGVTLEEDLEAGHTGVAAGQGGEDAALVGKHGEPAALLGKQGGAGLDGDVVSDQARDDRAFRGTRSLVSTLTRDGRRSRQSIARALLKRWLQPSR